MFEDHLSPLDASFLQIEDDSANMSVGGIEVLVGPPPTYEEFLETIGERLEDLPRYRQKLATVPLGLGRPRWVDDPRFRLTYHVRHTALPAPGGVEQLQALFGRIFSQPLSRDRPLWELWLVEGFEDDRFAVIHKMHHALVDGIASIGVLETLFDTEPGPSDGHRPSRWRPEPEPSTARIVVEAALERAAPPELARSLARLVRAPRQATASAVRTVAGFGGLVRAAAVPAPSSPYNTPVGPHRRFAWQRESLDDLKAVKDALEGSLNDVVLATVAGALGQHLRHRGHDTDGFELHVFVPVSVRGSDDEDDAQGNEVSGLKVPLPVGIRDPLDRFRRIHETMDELKESSQVVGAQTVIEINGLAPPGLLDRLSRLGTLQRYVNLVVTNVPGPQHKLYLLGRELEDILPLVPLGANLALGIAIVSYAGRMEFGFTADAEAMADVDELPGYLHASLAELAQAAGVRLSEPPAAGGGDPAGNGEPWPGYDEETVKQISARIDSLDPGALEHVEEYERRHKDRAGVRRAVEGRAS